MRFHAFFIFDVNATDVRLFFNDVTRNAVTCSLTLCHVTENRYVKCPAHFFRWNIFYSLRYEQNFWTNRITAGKLMNMKKLKLSSLKYAERLIRHETDIYRISCKSNNRKNNFKGSPRSLGTNLVHFKLQTDYLIKIRERKTKQYSQ